MRTTAGLALAIVSHRIAAPSALFPRKTPVHIEAARLTSATSGPLSAASPRHPVAARALRHDGMSRWSHRNGSSPCDPTAMFGLRAADHHHPCWRQVLAGLGRSCRPGCGDRSAGGDHDSPQSAVGLAVTAAVEPVAGHLARGGRDERGAAQVRPGGLGPQSARVVPGGDQQGGGGRSPRRPMPAGPGRSGSPARTAGHRGAPFSSSRAGIRRPRIRRAVLVATMTGSAPSRCPGRSAAARAASCWRATPARGCRSSFGAV